MTVNKKPYNFRFDPVLMERIDHVRGSLNRTEFIEEAVDKALGEHEVMGAFECPVAGCGYGADSPKAVCGQHGRTVVSRL